MMSSEERLEYTVKLQVPDRVPCAPLIENYAARYAAISNYEYLFDVKKAFGALAKLRKENPVWDVCRSFYFLYYGPYQKKIGILKNKLPGIDLPPDSEHQVEEYEAMGRGDYKIILEQGYREYLLRFYAKAHGASREEIFAAEQERLQIHLREIQAARERGQVPLYGAFVPGAADAISIIRSFEQFIRDLYQVPDLLQEVLEVVTAELIEECKRTAALTGIPRAMIGMARVSGQFLSRELFERFGWRYIKRMAEELIAAGITPFLHLDSDWTANLEHFLELPRGKFVLELDGCTDIFKAKEILGGHTCLLGDVNAILLAVGTPAEVEEYCRKLVAKVGKDGGFILGSGCNVPYMAKHENVRAMFQSLEKFGWYR